MASITFGMDSPYRIALLMAILVGVFVRFWGLGRWPLATDEYFIAQSVLNIIGHGLPRFECGGFYVRGLIQQYVTVPFVLFSTDVEWAARVPATIGNILGIPAVFILGRRLGGSLVAGAATILFCFSIWEIEFARFARMYALFQTMFLWYLVFLVRAMVDKKRSALVWMYAISFSSLILYEGAILMVCLNFVPFFTGTFKLNMKRGLISVTLLVAAIGYRAIDFRHWGALAAMPSELSRVDIGTSAASLPISMPILLGTILPNHNMWLIAAVVPLVISVWALKQVLRANVLVPERIFWLSVIICSALNLIGLLILGAILGLVIRLLSLARLDRSFPVCGKIAIAAATTNLAFWVLFTATTSEWTVLLGESANGSYISDIFKVMIDFPNIYGKVVYPWATAMPVMTGMSLLIIGVVATVLSLRPNSLNMTLRVLVFVFVLMVLIVGGLETQYHSSRYTFFLYPVLLLIISAVFRAVSFSTATGRRQSLSAYWAFIGIFAILSEDFSINHLTNIATPEINFRMGYDPARQDMYYYRRDYSTPAEFVNSHVQSGEIVISPLMPSLSFYLRKLDYVYLNRSREFYSRYVACDGTREMWSGSRLVQDKDQFYAAIEESKVPVWLIMYADDWRGTEERILSARYENNRVYTNIDRTIDVYYIVPGG